MKYVYMVINTEHAVDVDWNTVVQADINTVRFNKDKSKLILKSNHGIPSWYVDKPIYNQTQIKQLLATPAW